MNEFLEPKETRIKNLGTCRVNSTAKMADYVEDDAFESVYTLMSYLRPALGNTARRVPQFQLAGPRKKIYFHPHSTRVGIVTCGGLCPGLNDVIRSVVMSLYYHYKVRDIYGFRFGYQGLTEDQYLPPLMLTPSIVSRIHYSGGTILGSSRGNPGVDKIVDYLIKQKINILFTIGGDGTLKGARAISQESRRRGYKLSVVGIPKTIDNDIQFVSRTFGFATAIEEARKSIETAYNEARGAIHGLGIVKLMGRDSGFIAAHASLANNDVDFCLIPEHPFQLHGNHGLLFQLKKRIIKRGSGVIVVAEGAGQHLFEKAVEERDPSGNLLHHDIGLYLRDQISAYFKKKEIPLVTKYIDPSYTIRSLPANAEDSALCLMLGQNAVHAAMAGKTEMIVGLWKDSMVHIPIDVAVKSRRTIDIHGHYWQHVTFATGQPPLVPAVSSKKKASS